MVLVVLRGSSGAGKSSVAAGLRAAYGRGVAVVGQDSTLAGTVARVLADIALTPPGRVPLL